ncbi:hypothetical protein [Halocatena marina]|uniref:hypothetical protein n=1 Tax=Halocatena marina TaxID=2934937 RepID=UPI0036F25B76
MKDPGVTAPENRTGWKPSSDVSSPPKAIGFLPEASRPVWYRLRVRERALTRFLERLLSDLAIAKAERSEVVEVGGSGGHGQTEIERSEIGDGGVRSSGREDRKREAVAGWLL